MASQAKFDYRNVLVEYSVVKSFARQLEQFFEEDSVVLQVPKIGHFMKFMRAGSGKLVQNLPGVVSAPDSITVSSEEFAYGDPMPARFSHMGGNLSPALSWAGVPPEAKEIVLIVEDPDAPMPNPFVHAIAYGMDPSVKCLSEGILLGRHLGQASPHCLKIGKNTFGNTGYYGPAPIPEHGKHHYYFQVFALDKTLSFKRPPSLKNLLKQMEDHVIARGALVGTFERT